MNTIIPNTTITCTEMVMNVQSASEPLGGKDVILYGPAILDC